MLVVLSEDLLEYRVQEAKLVAGVVRSFLAGTTTVEYVRGAVEMVRKVIALPESLAQTEEEKERAKELVQRMFSLLESELARRMLE